MVKLFFLVLLLSQVSTTLAQELHSSPHEVKATFLVPRFNVTGPGPQDYECISARSSDYYGIGVRLGLYFTWWTAWVASVGMPDEIATALDTNTVFLFANVIALVRCTITFVLTQLDGLVLMHLGMGTVIGVMSSWGYRTCRYKVEGPTAMKHFGGIGTHLRVLCCLALCIYAVWYWTTGVRPGNLDMVNDTDACRTVWTFMFGKIRAAGQIRIFYMIASIVWTLYFGIILAVAPVASWIRIREISRSQHPIGHELPKKLQLATGFNYKQLKYIYFFSRSFNAFWLGWSMITVELTLHYNHVSNVLGPQGRIYFPSQLIPMILGAFTFCRLIFKKYVRARDGNKIDVGTDEPSFPAPPKRVSTFKSLTRLLTPPMPVVSKQEVKKHNPADIDPRMKDANPAWRLMVSYLPWLSLLSRDGESNAGHKSNGDYEAAHDTASHDFWEQETPQPSPDPRREENISDPTFRYDGQVGRGSEKYNITRFDNTIS